MKILSYNISWSKQEKIDWLLGQNKPYINKYKTVVTGKESRFTYDHTGKGNFTSFLDYAFTNTEVKDYKLYSWEESNRMSDHLPICVEV